MSYQLGKPRSRKTAGPLACAALLAAALVATVSLAAIAPLFAQTIPTPPNGQRAAAGPLVALVVGNGRYAGSAALKQPPIDAGLIADRLAAFGFQLVSVASDGRACTTGGTAINLDLRAMRKAVQCAAEAARNARQILVYFSGHSIARDGKNYLVPSGAAFGPQGGPDNGPRKDQLFGVDEIIAAMRNAKPGLAILIIDAARATLARTGTEQATGLYRMQPTTLPLMVAYSAKVGAWTDPRSAHSGNSAPNRRGTPSAYVRRLLDSLTDDLDRRSQNLAALDVRALLMKAAQSDPGVRGPTSEVLIENVVAPVILGDVRLPGRKSCDLLRWRADNLGRCIEIAATYEHCGKNDKQRTRLRQVCAADWRMLVQSEIRRTLAKAMRKRTCAALNEAIAKFDNEPATNEIPEFSDARSLRTYTCALEQSENLKTAVQAAIGNRKCEPARKLLASSSGKLNEKMRNDLQQLVKQVCCPEVSLNGKCLTRSNAVSRIADKFEEQGCSLGTATAARTARTNWLIQRIGGQLAKPVDASAGGTELDGIWTALQTLKKEDCSCLANETIADDGSCRCPHFSTTAPRGCLPRVEAIKALQQGVETIGCDIGGVDGNLGRKSKSILQRLHVFDDRIKDADLTPTSFTRMHAILTGPNKPTRERLCSEYKVEPSLNGAQRRAVDDVTGAHDDEPYAAVAVAGSCTSGTCTTASAVRERDAKTAERKAIAACQAKPDTDKCIIAARHHPAPAQ